GGACGFAADWSGHLTNYEFYLDSINRLVAPSGFESIVYTDSSSIEWTFDIQNLTRNSQAIIPSLTGQFNLSHDCNQTLEPLEHCRMTLSFVGDKSTKAEVAGELQLNSSKVIPISLVVTGTETPPVITEPTPELPKEVVMHIGLDDPSSVEHRIDVSFLSTVDHILEPSMTLEFAPEEALYWAYAESEGSVDISTDPAIGKYRVAPTEWIVEFVSQRDLPENEQHLAAKPGVYKATIRTSTATIPVTVHYREDEITDPDNPDTGNPDPDPDTPDPEEGNGSSGGGSGGSLGWFSLLMLFCLRRHK
ncbi:GlyGly-CTERM sorting domain-containing protein, partial [Vibrio alginolyticus]|uniref:GlyGly-CTERM sorting domain-containing protein n=1 Tax=Vibrio alginolyticus TaxID=663 RepID=UPI0015F725CA